MSDPDYLTKCRVIIAVAMKSLRKDEGVTLEKVSKLPEAVLVHLGGYKDPSIVLDLIRWSAESMPDDRYSRAIKNALALSGYGAGLSTLTERRMQLLEILDVSLRTLITYEDTGAEMLAHEIQRNDLAKNTAEEFTDLEQLAVQVVRIRETVAKSGIDINLPYRLAQIERRLGEIEAKLAGIQVQTPDASVSDLAFIANNPQQKPH